MKRIILLVLFAIVSQGVFAQSFESAILRKPNAPMYDYTQKVRVLNNERSIVLSKGGSGYAFYLVQKESLITKKIEFSFNETINDFCIFKDTIYFSGNDNNGTYIAKFPL